MTVLNLPVMAGVMVSDSVFMVPMLWRKKEKTGKKLFPGIFRVQVYKPVGFGQTIATR